VDLSTLGQLTLPTVGGQPQQLGGLWADQRVVLVFLRHFG
jgi:hypothetical protein